MHDQQTGSLFGTKPQTNTSSPARWRHAPQGDANRLDHIKECSKTMLFSSLASMSVSQTSLECSLAD